MQQKYIVPNGIEELYLKEFLQKYTGVSLTLWRKLKNHSTFWRNGIKIAPAISKVMPGDEIIYELSAHSSLKPSNMPLDILYEDEYLLIVNKASGQLVHPTVSMSNDTMANAVLFYYQTTRQRLAFHPIHRLDKNTSGAIMIAKLPQIQHLLANHSCQFTRSYLGLIPSRLTPLAGLINKPIARKPGSIIERIVSPIGKPAQTKYKTIQEGKNISLLEFQLCTGRTHQIRVHMSYMGHPLLGDDLYGGDCKKIQRQALHAYHICFKHPINGKLLSIYAPLPKDMKQIVTSML